MEKRRILSHFMVLQTKIYKISRKKSSYFFKNSRYNVLSIFWQIRTLCEKVICHMFFICCCYELKYSVQWQVELTVQIRFSGSLLITGDTSFLLVRSQLIELRGWSESSGRATMLVADWIEMTSYLIIVHIFPTPRRHL